MDRNLTTVRLTENAALYASRFMGRGDEELTYKSATEAMAHVFNSMDITAEVIIGSDDEKSPLTGGAILGRDNGRSVDVAVKPLDGKMTCARGGHNSMSIVAIGNKGCFPEMPSLYMKKIAVGRDAKGVVDINKPPEINIKRVARAKGKYIEDITVCVLDREHNRPVVEEIRKTGARIKFIRDGDISGAISAAVEDNPIDILMGIGGSKEGVLAAAALRCLGGDMQAKLICSNESETDLVRNFCNWEPERIISISDLIRTDDVMVSATGITDGVLLPGVRFFSGGAQTSSIVLRQKTHTVRFINAYHYFDYKPIF